MCDRCVKIGVNFHSASALFFLRFKIKTQNSKPIDRFELYAIGVGLADAIYASISIAPV